MPGRVLGLFAGPHGATPVKNFLAIARIRNITQAAAALHITQSTASGHLKSLEQELGTPLFTRTASGVELTGFGELAIAAAQTAVSASESLATAAKLHAGQVSGDLRIAAINDAETLGLGTLMSRMRAGYPLISVAIAHGLSGWALGEVKAERRDAGFYIGELHEALIRSVPIRKIRFCIAVPRQWQERVSSEKWSAIGTLPWLWVPALGSYPRLVTSLLASHGVTPTKVVETDREATLENLVEAGVGLALLREEKVRSRVNDGKIFLWEEGRIEALLSIFYLASRESDPKIQALLACAGSEAAEIGQPH